MTSRRTAPNSRPVHPCYMSVFEGTTGAEYSTWAQITHRNRDGIPDLVTAQASTLNVYTMEDTTAKFLWSYSFPNLSGNVCYLETLKSPDGHPDSLLVGFAGNPRLAIVTLKTTAPHQLLASTLLDLSPAVSEYGYGAVTPLEQDLIADLLQCNGSMTATLSVALGGGVALACIALKYEDNVWKAIMDEPYLLPLQSLSASFENKSTTPGGQNPVANTTTTSTSTSTTTKNELAQSIVTGFGDMIDTAFLPQYLEPTIVVLHSNPHTGMATSGRLGHQDGGTRFALQLSAISLSVTHQRSAILWTLEVPADAQQVHACGKHGCLVVSANSIVAISNTGQIDQCLAVNGWAMAGLTAFLQDRVRANPWPFPKLSIALDGCRLFFVNENTAFLCIRHGQLYLLQRSNENNTSSSSWSLLPLYSTIGAIAEVNDLQCCPLGKMLPSIMDDGKLLDKSKGTAGGGGGDGEVEMGLMFIGSRMGDSSLLGYALESTSVEKAIKEEPGLQRGIKTETSANNSENQIFSPQDDEYERILQLEEEALYASEDASPDGPNVIPPSDDEETTMVDNDNMSSSGHAGSRERKRVRLSQLVVVRSLTMLDSITAFGPIGPGCTGPLAAAPEYTEITDPTSTATPPLGASGYIFPCGYGSSGGLALLTAPGRDDRNILAEEDCVNAKAIFSLPERGFVLLGLVGGIRFMKLDSSSNGTTMAEINLDEWVSDDVYGYVMSATMLSAYEWNSEIFAVLVEVAGGNSKTYTLLIMNDQKETLDLQAEIVLNVSEGEIIQTVTPFAHLNPEKLCFGYTLSSGDAYLVVVNTNGELQELKVEATATPMEIGEKDLSEEEQFYTSGSVKALDVFEAPEGFFSQAQIGSKSEASPTAPDTKLEATMYVMDDDDMELYGISTENEMPSGGDVQEVKPEAEDVAVKEQALYFALCRQSGDIEVYAVSDWIEDQAVGPVWSSSGCGHGVPLLLSEKQDGPAFRAPRMHKLYAKEMRFFFCGPSSSTWATTTPSGPRVFCLAVEGNKGDIFLYKAEVQKSTKCLESFSRVPLKYSTRPSQEQAKHFLKLRRKGIVGKSETTDTDEEFRYSSLFRVTNISGQDGLFAAAARPIWLVAERGRPALLCHRLRHVAPAGSRPRPISGFCSGLVKSAGQGHAFITLHERVGRVGSQRLTVFKGIFNLENTQNLLPGGGIMVEKIPFGVTVRRIQFIDDPKISSANHPLYAVLVSRELEGDMSHINSDGLSAEERQRLADEKENAKIKKQVEADLGGFEKLEQEWVEEIEREDCFKVDTSLGGAPTCHTSAYSLWIVDAANGWMVVDSYEFESYEHALTMQVMLLSEFTEEPGSSMSEEISEEDMENKLFIAVGTGIVDKDGEDVSSKGRVLLFNVTKPDEKTASLQVAELNFVYEKKIFHGPVSTLSCLSSDRKNRLVIGAGADVNVEQWGNEKLSQVGFFRATMYVLDIKLFKNFFVLSDAYDSLYFLVWRESDKSLTLLAKDYDPIPVYASGLLSRGGSLDLVCHDDRQNLQFFQYAPGDAAARGGNKLVCRADFHLGSQTTDLQSYFCRSSLLINSATPPSTLAALQQQDKFFGRADDDQRLGIHFGTTDGGYGAIVPFSEPTYWRLTALQSVMVNALESDCALSLRAWRLYRRTPRRGGCRSNDRKKGVIDGDFIIQYVDLATADQEDLASAIGSTVELVLDNILELRCSAMVI